MVVAPRAGDLFSFSKGRFERILSLPTRTHSISESRDGSLWLSTASQLLRWKEGRLTAYGSPSDRYSYSYEDANGIVWAGSRLAGLVCVRDERLIRFAPLGVPFSDRIHYIFDDGVGNLWVTTPHGVFRVRKAELIGFADGKVRQVLAAPFGMPDGLPSTGCNAGEQNPGWTDHEGRFWIPTGRGIAVLDPRRLTPDTSPPHAIIEQVTVDEQPVDPVARAKLSPDHRRISFRYTGISLRAPQFVRFRYILEGFDRNWVDPGGNREVSYTGLRAGKYRFRLSAGNRDGLWNESEAMFSFRVAPYFYHTLWFYCACLSFFALILAGIYSWRSRQIQERAEVALIERTKMAREIHDTLLQGVAGASLALQAIASAITDKEPRETFDNALNEMQRCMTETRRALWDMRSSEPENLDLVTSLDSFGQALSAPSGIRFSIHVHGVATTHRPGVQRDLLQIGREAILNAIKHARATEIRVDVFFSNGSIRLSVDDDGRGFYADDMNAPGHWGLVGMRERAKGLAAELAISSRPGGGTRVEATVPLQREKRFVSS